MRVLFTICLLYGGVPEASGLFGLYCHNFSNNYGAILSKYFILSLFRFRISIPASLSGLNSIIKISSIVALLQRIDLETEFFYDGKF
jgi:hypothetical protein